MTWTARSLNIVTVSRRLESILGRLGLHSLVLWPVRLVVALVVALLLYSLCYVWRIRAERVLGPIQIDDCATVIVTYPRYLFLGQSYQPQDIDLELIQSKLSKDAACTSHMYIVEFGAPQEVILLDPKTGQLKHKAVLTSTAPVASVETHPVAGALSEKTVIITARILRDSRLEAQHMGEPAERRFLPLRFQLEVDSWSNSGWHAVLMWVVSNGEWLALVLAVVLAVWEWHKYQDSEAKKKKEARVEAIRGAELRTIHDNVHAIQLLIEANGQIQQKSMSSEEQDELKLACESLILRASEWRPLLRKLGLQSILLPNHGGLGVSAEEKPGQQGNVQVSVILDKLVDLYQCTSYYKNRNGAELARQFSSLRRAIFNTGTSSESDLSNTNTCQSDGTVQIEDVLTLFDTYSSDVRDLVATALSKLITCKTMACYLSECLQKPKERRSLLRHDRLRPIVKQYCSLAKQSNYRYVWPSPYHAKPNAEEKENTEVDRWLRKAGLEQNPFSGVNHLPSDELLAKTWADPPGWQSIEAPGNVLIYGQYPVDLYACALHLLGQFRPAEDSPTPISHFPVWTFIDLAPTVEPQSILISITRGYGDAWRDILACYPTAFQEIGTVEQEMLAELLVWCAGSRQVLLTWLRKTSEQRNGGEKAHVSWLYNRLEELTPEHPVSGVPNDRILLDWLRLRPPGYGRTLLIAAASPEVEIGYSELKWLIHRRFELDAQGIDLKIFVNLGVTDVGKIGIDTVPLSWTSETLAYIINQRITFASNGKIGDFSGLFDRSPRKAEQEIAEVAQGSLHRALQLADQVIQRHVASDPTRKNIRFNILDDVLREKCG